MDNTVCFFANTFMLYFTKMSCVLMRKSYLVCGSVTQVARGPPRQMKRMWWGRRRLPPSKGWATARARLKPPSTLSRVRYPEVWQSVKDLFKHDTEAIILFSFLIVRRAKGLSPRNSRGHFWIEPISTGNPCWSIRKSP